MLRPLLVAFNEVRLYLQDKGDLAFSLLLPVITFALIYGAFGGQTLFQGTAYIVNEEKQDPLSSFAPLSSILVGQLQEMDGLEVELLTPEEADTKLERSDVLLVLYIPEDFSQKLSSGEAAQLVFRQRGNGGQDGQIVASLIRGAVENLNQIFQVQSQVKESLAGKGIPEESINITVQKYLAEERQFPAVGVSEETVGSSPDLVNQFLPGIVTMYVLFAITISARAIVEERKKGTLERLLTTRLSVGQLFFGKFLASVSRGLVQTFILLVLAYIVFQLFTPLSFIASLVFALVFAAAGSALGMVIASIARSEDGAVWIAVVFTMAMVMLGGTFFEISEGSALYTISRFSINTYANDAFKTIINQGGSLADVGLEIGILAGVAVAGLVISRILFRALPGGGR